MRKELALFSGLFFLLLPAARAAEPDLTGTYEYQGNIRSATISKVEIQKVKGQHRVHVWFYGRPNDVDWGETAATEYHNLPMRNTPDLVVTMQHEDSKAIVVVRVDGAVNEKVNRLNVQSWVSWTHPDERHQNETAQDFLIPKK